MQKSEKEALAMEKSTKKQPEIPNETEDLLEKEIKAEIKRKEKRNRKIIRAVKGQIILKCPYEKSVCPKIATKIFPRFLSWKFITSRLTQKESLCSVCKKIDYVL